MSEKRCCVPNCDKSRPEVRLHKFPNPCKEPERFRTWLYAIGGDILALENSAIFKNRRICQRHFMPQYISIKMLTTTAIPTLHMAGFVTNRREPLVITNQFEQNMQMDQIPSTSREILPEISTSNNEVQIIVSHDSSLKLKRKATKEKRGKSLSRIYSTEVSVLARQVQRLKKTKASYATKLKKALDLSENINFQKMIKRFTTAASIFTCLQFREVGKKKSGRRYTNKEKIMALALCNKAS